MKKSMSMGTCFIIFSIIMIVGFVGNGFLSSAKPESGDQTSYKYYTSIQIADGDTLWDIAQNYITDEYPSVDSYIKEVRQINSMLDSTIQAGDYITVPYYSLEYKE
ncbi:MAG TPA: LysM peptidoglycan-binding domain-containing protein [Candidatus Merdenecus merdavium]|nr:LysM peptidoglycan-binding domain-containing protein [Candidatus Merdenecus merdavium]